jgi:hypothetical protein
MPMSQICIGAHPDKLVGYAYPALAGAAFAAAIAEKPAGRFMIRNRSRAVKRHPEGDR